MDPQQPASGADATAPVRGETVWPVLAMPVLALLGIVATFLPPYGKEDTPGLSNSAVAAFYESNFGHIGYWLVPLHLVVIALTVAVFRGRTGRVRVAASTAATGVGLLVGLIGLLLVLYYSNDHEAIDFVTEVWPGPGSVLMLGVGIGLVVVGPLTLLTRRTPDQHVRTH